MVAIGGPLAPVLRWTWIHTAIAAVLAAACLSLVVDARYLNQTLEFLTSAKKLTLLLSYAMLFVIVASSIRRAEVPAFLKYTLFLAVLCALGTIWEYRFHYNVFYGWSDKLLPGFFSVGHTESSAVDEIGRRIVIGPGEISLEAAAMLSMGLPIALVGIMSSARWRGRLLYGLAASILMAGAISTYRKTALIAPVSAILTLAYYRRRELVRLAPLGVVVLVAVHVLSPGAFGAIAEQLHPTRLGAVSTVSDRTSDYDAVRPDVWTHLAFGRGYGSYEHTTYRVLDMEMLRQLIEVGVVGLTAYIMLMVSIVATARAPIRRRRPDESRVALAAAATAVSLPGHLDPLRRHVVPALSVHPVVDGGAARGRGHQPPADEPGRRPRRRPRVRCGGADGGWRRCSSSSRGRRRWPSPSSRPAQGKRERHANPGNLGSVLGKRARRRHHPAGLGRLRDLLGRREEVHGDDQARARSPGHDPARAATRAAHLRFVGLTIAGAKIRAPAHDITIARSRFTAAAQIDATQMVGADILLDRDTFSGIDVCSDCFEGRVTVHGREGQTQPVGVTVQNSLFNGGGNSDGIQVGAYGVRVLHNEFTGIHMVDATHTDAIQLYGQSHTIVRGNYIHNAASGIMAPDGTSHELIEDNVIRTDGAPARPSRSGPTTARSCAATRCRAAAATTTQSCGILTIDRQLRRPEPRHRRRGQPPRRPHGQRRLAPGRQARQPHRPRRARQAPRGRGAVGRRLTAPGSAAALLLRRCRCEEAAAAVRAVGAGASAADSAQDSASARAASACEVAEPAQPRGPSAMQQARAATRERRPSRERASAAG